MRILATCLTVLFVVGACSDEADHESSDEAAELLETEGHLDSVGRVQFGPSGPNDDEVDEALCDYLFGTIESVVDRLGEDVTLDDGSGYGQLGANGSGIQCIYNLDDEPIFAVSLWSHDLTEDSDSTDVVVTDVPSGDVGFSMYNPDYDGDKVDDDTIVAWLEEAGSRYAGQSV